MLFDEVIHLGINIVHLSVVDELLMLLIISGKVKIKKVDGEVVGGQQQRGS